MHLRKSGKMLTTTALTACLAGFAFTTSAVLAGDNHKAPFNQPDPSALLMPEAPATGKADPWGDFFDALEEESFGYEMEAQQPQPNPNPQPANPNPAPPAPAQPKPGVFSSMPPQMQKKDGLFPVYMDPRNGSVAMVIGKNQITTDDAAPKEFIYHYQIRNGLPQMRNETGRFMFFSRVVDFRMKHGRIEVYSRQLRFKYDDDSPLKRGEGQNMSDALVAVLRVVATSDDGGSYLVDPRPLFLSQSLAPIFGVRVAGPYGGKKPFARVTDVRNFDENTSIRVELATTAGIVPQRTGGVGLQNAPEMADNRNVLTEIQHTFLAMPDEEGFKPRMTDQRVGFFPEWVTNLTSKSVTPYEDMARRWRLVKQDPTAEVSPPVKPITFWIENTTPLEFRDTIRDAALEWNKAFRAAGFENALEIKVQPDDADWDADDIRYNVLRWVASPTPSYLGSGPSFANPRTGETLGADIMLEYTVMRSYYWLDRLFAKAEAQEAEAAEQSFSRLPRGRTGSLSNAVNMFGQLSDALRNDGIDLAALLGAQTDHKTFEDEDGRILDLVEFLRAEDNLATGNGPSPAWAKRVDALVSAGHPDHLDHDGEVHAHHHNASHHNAAHHMHQQTMFGMMSMVAQGADPSEIRKMIKESLYFLIIHEIGHTLGLAHNFQSSQLHSLDDIHNPALTREKGLIGSIMDYPMINIAGPGRTQGEYFPTTVGPYDIWAIKFGYTPVKDDPEAEKAWREELLGQSLDPELAFGHDVDRFLGIDPRTEVFDLSSDPVGYHLERFALVDQLLTGLKDRYTVEGESWHALRQAYGALLGQDRRGATVLSRYIGGVKIERFVAGQSGGNLPFEPVSAEDQKKAMQGLARYIFAPTALSAPAQLYPFLQGQDRIFLAPIQDPKIHNVVLATQMTAVMQIMNPQRVMRIMDSSLYGNEYALLDVMGDLTDALFKEDLGGSVNTHRQLVQATFVRWLRSMVAGNLSKSYNDVAIAAALKTLKDINTMMAPGFFGINEAALDASTVAHRANLRRLIKPVL